MAKDRIYNFLKNQNRPFSVNDVLENIGNEYGKTAVQKSLDDLTEMGKIFEKIYGKQKIYCVTQEINVDHQQLGRQFEQEINTLTEKLKHNENELQLKITDLRALQGKMTTADAKCKRNEMREQVLTKQNKLQAIKEDSNPITAEEKIKIVNEHDKYLKEYRQRKRICMDITNSILENYPKSKKHLFEEIGIETDEDAGFKVSSF